MSPQFYWGMGTFSAIAAGELVQHGHTLWGGLAMLASALVCGIADYRTRSKK